MAKRRTDLKVPYGVSDFRRIRNEGFYYVDKTPYLAQMEKRDSFIFFVRPRRFGKSLFISMMESYYDLNQKKDFKKLFGGLWLGAHPTENANRFMTLKLDFSKVGGTGEALERAFEEHIGKQLDDMVSRYPVCFDAGFRASFGGQPASGKLADVVNTSRRKGIPLYLIIDEYDNFTNQMIRATGVDEYHDITHGSGFYRNWFKKFKGDFDRIFMTGVSPVPRWSLRTALPTSSCSPTGCASRASRTATSSSSSTRRRARRRRSSRSSVRKASPSSSATRRTGWCPSSRRTPRCTSFSYSTVVRRCAAAS